EDKGGWLVRGTVDAFRRYAEAVVRRLGDRVDRWFTVNEIPCFIGFGYQSGYFAPGRQEPPRLVNQGFHHAILAHGHAVRVVREFGRPGSVVGLVQNQDRKSTRLNSSHGSISYAVFCLKKKKLR